MKNKLTMWIILLPLLVIIACQKETTIIGEAVSDQLWLVHKEAQMPILVEGNTASKIFILILHGGPGGTATAYNETNLEMSQPLEKRYAVAYWDQRLSGNAKGNFKEETITPAIMIEDTDKAIELLRHRYGQDISIFLLGHSWGGYLGNAYLAQSESNQAKIKGWIDVAGAHNIEKIIRDGLDLMEEVATNQIAKRSDKAESWEDVQSFVEDIRPVKTVDREISLKVNREANRTIGLASADNLIIENILEQEEAKSHLYNDNHALANFVHLIQMNKTNIWETLLKQPLTEELHKIKIPALLIWGKYDFVVPPSLGEEAFQNLGTDSQDKSFHIFNRSGHSPSHDEPAEFVDLVVEFVETYK